MCRKLKYLVYMTRTEVNAIRNDIFLTQNENDVLDLLLKGKSAQEIADRICVCDRTVYRIEQSIAKKINSAKLRY